MVKLIAHTKAYHGGRIVEAGEGLEYPDELWADKDKRPLWADEARASTEAPATDTAIKPPPVEVIAIPADWEDMSATDRKALAVKISGEMVTKAADADKIIEAYVKAHKPEPFADAPAPQTVTDAQKANGGMQPDWEAPGEAKQVAD